MDNGARRALIPLENKRHFLEVSGDIVERVDPVFFSDPMMAAMKALGMGVIEEDLAPMPGKSITLDLPEDLYERVRQVAEQSQRPLERVLVESIRLLCRPPTYSYRCRHHPCCHAQLC